MSRKKREGPPEKTRHHITVPVETNGILEFWCMELSRIEGRFIKMKKNELASRSIELYSDLMEETHKIKYPGIKHSEKTIE